ALFGKARVRKLQQDAVYQFVEFVVVAADPNGDAAQMRVNTVIQPGQPGGVGPGIEVGGNGVYQQLGEHSAAGRGAGSRGSQADKNVGLGCIESGVPGIPDVEPI